MIKTDIKSLSGQYIICKRVRKVPFYWRGDHYKQTSQVARGAHKFATKDEADKKCADINAARKSGYKFRVESAEKHFVSSFKIQYNTWNKEITVTNEHKSIQLVTKQKSTIVHDLNVSKTNIIDTIKQASKRHLDELEKERLAYNQMVLDTEASIAHLQNMISYVESTDLTTTYVEPNLTKTDKTVNVLYGRK